MLKRYLRAVTVQGMAIQRRVRPPFAWMVITLAVALGVKQLFRSADVEDLLWILAPVARMVGGVLGFSFTYEAHSGFVNLERGLMIVPSCAGVNFMIMAWGVLAMAGLQRLSAFWSRLGWLLAILPLAYGLTLGVNSLRILLSVHFYRLDIYGDWLTPDRLHRVLGILIYFGVLCGVYKGALRALDRMSCRLVRSFMGQAPDSRRAGLNAPLFWYGLFAIGIPLARRAYRHQPNFWEHFLTVVLGCMVVLLAAFLVQRYQPKRSVRDEAHHFDS